MLHRHRHLTAWLGVLAIWFAIAAPLVSPVARRAGGHARQSSAVRACAHPSPDAGRMHDHALHLDACGYCGFFAHNPAIGAPAAAALASIPVVSVSAVASPAVAARSTTIRAHTRAPRPSAPDALFPFHSSPISVRPVEAAWRASLRLSIATIFSCVRRGRHAMPCGACRVLKLTVPALAVGALAASAAAAETRAHPRADRRDGRAAAGHRSCCIAAVDAARRRHGSEDAASAAARQRRRGLPENDPRFHVDPQRRHGDLVLRGMFGSRLNILANRMSTLGACPGRMDAPTSYIAPESMTRSPS